MHEMNRYPGATLESLEESSNLGGGERTDVLAGTRAFRQLPAASQKAPPCWAQQCLAFQLQKMPFTCDFQQSIWFRSPEAEFHRPTT